MRLSARCPQKKYCGNQWRKSGGCPLKTSSGFPLDVSHGNLLDFSSGHPLEYTARSNAFSIRNGRPSDILLISAMEVPLSFRCGSPLEVCHGHLLDFFSGDPLEQTARSNAFSIRNGKPSDIHSISVMEILNFRHGYSMDIRWNSIADGKSVTT